MKFTHRYLLSLIFLLVSKLGFAADYEQMDFYKGKMAELIAYAKEKNPQYPFAAMIIKRGSGEELCRGINSTQTNPLLHGETDAILNCIGIYEYAKLDWRNLALITTAEPCSMCLSAVLWASIGVVVFGTSQDTLIKKGWDAIKISSEEVCNRSSFARKPIVIGGVLVDQTDPLFMDYTDKMTSRKE
jgi:tRNA(Arg) A34 adenosine deaminase TadA